MSYDNNVIVLAPFPHTRDPVHVHPTVASVNQTRCHPLDSTGVEGNAAHTLQVIIYPWRTDKFNYLEHAMAAVKAHGLRQDIADFQAERAHVDARLGVFSCGGHHTSTCIIVCWRTLR